LHESEFENLRRQRYTNFAQSFSQSEENRDKTAKKIMIYRNDCVLMLNPFLPCLSIITYRQNLADFTFFRTAHFLKDCITRRNNYGTPSLPTSFAASSLLTAGLRDSNEEFSTGGGEVS
jgi:hypothetical protein